VSSEQIGSVARQLLADLSSVHERLAQLPSPYGDGSASTTIVTEIRRRFGE
jgi:UDP-N-acetylglucosamine 2-epimerase